jgi:hypothetical protein
VFEPHLPKGWNDIRIADLPVGANLVSFSRTRTAEGVFYDIEAAQSGWTFVLKEPAAPGARYFLNGSEIHPSPSGIRMDGRRNRVLSTSRH